MHILHGSHLDQANQFLKQTIEVARQATCQRSKCGSIIVRRGEIIGRGFNSPPGNLESQRRCGKKDQLLPGFKSDRTCCIHAEQRAIMDALAHHPDKLPNSRLYFIRLDQHGQPQPAGQPYCTICSKMALDAGVGEFTLLHPTGLTIYDTQEYNDLSYQYNGES